MRGTRLPAVLIIVMASLLGLTLAPAGGARRERIMAWVLTRSGQSIEGEVESDSLSIEVDGKARNIGLGEVLTVQIAGGASAYEDTRIGRDLSIVSANTDRPAREAAVAELTDIGLPVLPPLLAAYKDTDLHEPNPLYRLFARIVPGYADRLDRTLDLIRLANGEVLRGRVTCGGLKLVGADRKVVDVDPSLLRRLAVRRRAIDKTFDVQALRHCTQIEFLDTGVGVGASSRIEETAQGLVRLSFDIDGWASDPDGIKVPGPHYTTNLVDGFPFGALVGRVGPGGPRWLAGHKIQKSAMERGRLYFAVNDNGHWQNNIGSFRVRLRAADAYDLGDPQ